MLIYIDVDDTDRSVSLEDFLSEWIHFALHGHALRLMINKVYSSAFPTPTMVRVTSSLRTGRRISRVADRHFRC